MNKKHSLPLALTLGLLALVGILLALETRRGGPSIAHAQSTVRYVAATGNDTGDCTNAGSPCRTVQYAVDQAGGGDEVRIAAGIYTDVQIRPRRDFTVTGFITQAVYISKTVTLRGGFTTTNWTTSDPVNNPTILDAEGQGRGIYVTGAISPVIEGLHVTGGDASGLWGSPYLDDAGGGIYIITATATVSRCWVYSNTAPGLVGSVGGAGIYVADAPALISGTHVYSNYTDHYGGGIYLYHSPATLRGNVIHDNQAGIWGGGIRLLGSPATVIGNVVYRNHAYYGGGIEVADSAALVRQNQVLTNSAVYGGGISAVDDLNAPHQAILQQNLIQGNTAQHGGGLVLFNGTTQAVHNTVQGNVAEQDGGGVYLYYTPCILRRNLIQSNTVTAGDGGGIYSYLSNCTLENNVVADNHLDDSGGQGAGFYVTKSLGRFSHTTIARNDGGDGSGLYVYGYYGPILLTDTIVTEQTTGVYGAYTGGDNAILNYVLWYGNGVDVGGPGPIVVSHTLTGDPAFDADGYHLTGASAALDAGTDAGVEEDIDGDFRPQGAGYDLGADELPGAALQVSKQASDLLPAPGQTLTYTLIITSRGVIVAADTHLTDTLPPRQQALAVASDRGTCSAAPGWGGGATCALGDLSPSTTAHITLTAQVTTTTPPQPIVMRNRAEVAAVGTANDTYLDTVLQDCHARVNGAPPEYDTVQAAVDAAASGDTVTIAGVCVGVNERGGLAQQVYVEKNLTLQGGWNTAFTERDPALYPTVLDAMGAGRVLVITGTTDVLVEGLRLTGGDASHLLGGPHFQPGDGVGGGVYVHASIVTFSDTVIYGNVASRENNGYGGGLGVWLSTLTLRNSVVRDNSASTANVGRGGGVYLEESAATVSDTLILTNTASSGSTGYGGGLYLDTADRSAVITAATLQGNIASTAGRGDGGGAFVAAHSDQVVMSNNLVQGNIASMTDNSCSTCRGHGGGMLALMSNVVLTGNLFLDNTASTNPFRSGQGGGLSIWYGAATVNGNTIRDNVGNPVGEGQGGGVYLYLDDSTLSGNDILSNTADEGGGLYLSNSDAILDGNLVRYNAAGAGGGAYLLLGEPAIANTVIADNHLSGGDGAGFYLAGSAPRLWHATIARNDGGDGSGLYAESYLATVSTAHLTNTIIVSQSIGVMVATESSAILDGVLWHGNEEDAGGPGIVVVDHAVSGDPAFALDGYHIITGSAAVNGGVPCAVTTDIDGDPRPLGAGYDLGADETAVAALRLTKTPIWQAVSADELLTYTLVLTSSGDLTVANALLTDTLDLYQRPVAVTSDRGSCTIADPNWAGRVSCTLGDLAPGAMAHLTLTVRITDVVPAQPQLIVNTAQAAGGGAWASTRAQVWLHSCHVRLVEGANVASYGRIQAAVDAASIPTAEVQVAGTCMGTAGAPQMAYINKTLTLRGGYSLDFADWDPLAYPTTLDGMGEGRVLYLTGSVSPTLEGLRITGGDASGLGGDPSGHDSGGGIYVITATVTISGCRVYENVASTVGTARGGGVAIFAANGAVIRSSQILTNVASSPEQKYKYGYGGGICLYESHNLLLEDDLICDNVARSATGVASSYGYGGGVYVRNSDGQIRSSTFCRNTASTSEGK
ncbi:MAG TPA: DUF11 domain-containing protein, partial [Anaerolineae bacterium]|nr:DUF11 domain-containing protein [Anaerolineae bacterium]